MRAWRTTTTARWLSKKSCLRETGVVVDRLPPGHQCAESDEDVRALADVMEAIEQAQTLDRHSVRDRAAEEFDSDRIVDSIITAGDRHSGRV